MLPNPIFLLSQLKTSVVFLTFFHFQFYLFESFLFQIRSNILKNLCPMDKSKMLWWILFKKYDPLVAQMVKYLPAVQETRIWFMGWEDALEKGIATHLSILAWRIPGTEEPGGLQFMESQRAGHDWATSAFTFFS